MGHRSDIEALSAGKINEAPLDSNEYVRKNGQWAISSGPNMDSIFPVGSVFLTLSNTSPSALLGFGTWVLRGSGQTLIGA